MSPFCVLLILIICFIPQASIAQTDAQHRTRRDATKEIEYSNETKSKESPLWWDTCPNISVSANYGSSEEYDAKYVVSENHLAALIRVLPNLKKNMSDTHFTIQTKMTLTRRTISVKDTFRSTSFKSLNPILASSNMSLTDFQPYFSREIYVNIAKCHWLLFKLKDVGHSCFGPIIKSVKDLLCSRVNCFPQNWFLLRPWLPRFQTLITYNATKVYEFKNELEAMELFVQMIAATLELLQHNEQIMNGPYLSLVTVLNRCTIDLLCLLRLVVEQLEVIKKLNRVPVIDSSLFNNDRLLYRRGKSIMRPIYKDRILNFKEKVNRDLMPDTEHVILKEPQENLRAARLASVVFDLEALFDFLN